MSHKRWRLIDSGSGEAFINMALDEAIATGVREGINAPTLRIYSWDRPSVTLGRFQKRAEVDSKYCRDNNIPLVRRPTGGRAILHTTDELTYSFSAPSGSGLFCGSLFESYSHLSRAFMEAFTIAGLDVMATGRRKSAHPPNPGNKSPLCFSSTSYGEITLKGHKIIGSAQRRWSGGMLQQGSIPFKVPKQQTAAVFMTGDEAEGVLMGIHEADPSITYQSLKEAIATGFGRALDIEFDELAPTAEEETLALKLMTDKYSSPKWNNLR